MLDAAPGRSGVPSETDSGAGLGAGVLNEPFLAAVRQAPVPPDAAPPGSSPEVALWWAVAGASVDVDAAIAEPTEGSLLPQGLYRAIEVWTESDLCALHALWILAQREGRADWIERVDRVRQWHLEYTQPDNATNRAWALHVFLLGSPPFELCEPESRHYAETLLHNTIAMDGRPTPLNAWILLDAARWIESVPEQNEQDAHVS
ncbi:MAG: hypothetical protein EA377_05435 [Phycisphaerales bacterium]|nr:MAG: hypothetical protein EA377_05435 [Phycisphaerales bacterium]